MSWWSAPNTEQEKKILRDAGVIPHPDFRKRRPFEGYVDQPDTEAHKRLAVQAIEFGLPEKKPQE